MMAGPKLYRFLYAYILLIVNHDLVLNFFLIAEIASELSAEKY